MKTTIRIGLILLLCHQIIIAQYGISTQADRLQQYVGHWVCSIHADTDSIDAIPSIRMNNFAKMDNQSLQVEVLQYQNGEYKPLLTELISYDAKSAQIIALGQNAEGVVFKGVGAFSTERDWHMQDVDMRGDFYLQVDFDFESYTNVLLEGFDESGRSLWKTRYIKSNPKDKNIGIQLVSVHEEMLKAPVETVRELSRMGYSYVETFVYDNGTFYGMSPTEFRQVVEGQGMKFLGSMTFHNLPNALAELQGYCDYYNALGKLCKEKGLTFAFHNHADEFGLIEGVRIYDYLLENTNPEYVYFQADIYWMVVGGVKPVDYFQKYPKRFLSWHVKDYKE